MALSNLHASAAAQSLGISGVSLRQPNSDHKTSAKIALALRPFEAARKAAERPQTES